MPPPLHLGTAGWALPRAEQPVFPPEGTHLQRYAARFPAVEINSSFHRPHAPATYARWSASVPDHFRFAVKAPKTITHERRLADAEDRLDAFLAQVSGLGEKLGCLLLQLPPNRQPCHDCAVVKGQYHVPGCDVERCPVCDEQAAFCNCPRDDDEEES